MKASDARIREVQTALAATLTHQHATMTEGCSAMASLLMDTFVYLLDEGDDKVASEMRRMAQRLMILADTPRAEVRLTSHQLADSTLKS